MKYLFKLGMTWFSSKIYYDESQGHFLEERYHEEYLDTGTICDGIFPIADDELWEKIIREVHEEGVDAYLKIRGSAPSVTKNISGITIEDFKKQLAILKQENPWRCYKILKVGSVLVISDEKNNVLGILSNTVNFWFYIDMHTERKKHGFYTREEALAFALQRITEYHDMCIRNDKIANDKAIIASSDSNITVKKKGLFGRKK